MIKISKFICFILLLSFVLFPPRVIAQTVNVSPVQPKAATATPSPRLNKSITSLVNILKAMVLRLEKLSQRIAARLNKIYSSNINSTDTEKIIRLTTQQENLAMKIKQLKTDLTQLDLPKKDYILFRSQTMTLIGDIKDVYISESDLITQMKKIN